MRAIPLLAVVLIAACGCEGRDDSDHDESSTLVSEAPPGALERTVAPASRNETALETLRDHWDSEIITGVMVDEVKKVLDHAAPDDLGPLLDRIELLGRSGKAYAPDFALWWEERGRTELGGPIFWKRELLREAINVALNEHDEVEALRLIGEAATTGDPVARMWQAFAQAESGGRHEASALGELIALADQARTLADEGDPEAAFLLGIVASEGDMDIVQATPEDVARWFQTASNAGYGHATQMLAELKLEEQSAANAGVMIRRNVVNPDAHAAKLRASSQNNLKQLALVGKMFANESRGELWPALSPERGQLAMDPSAINPEYLTDPNVYISPAHADYRDLVDTARTDPRAAIRDHSYWYLGYAINSEAQGLELVKHLRSAIEAEEPLPDGFETPGLPTEQIFRLREGIERFFITDIHNPAASALAQAEIPIMIERPGMHDIGANVLFLDGHVEFHRYPGEFPMSEAFIQALESLDELKPRSTGGAFVP